MPRINIPQTRVLPNEPSVGRLPDGISSGSGERTVELSKQLQVINQHFKGIRDFREESSAKLSLNNAYNMVFDNQAKDDNPDNLKSYEEDIDKINANETSKITDPLLREKVAFKFEALGLQAKSKLSQTANQQYVRQARGNFYSALGRALEESKTADNETLEVNAVELEDMVRLAEKNQIIHPSEANNILKSYKKAWGKARDDYQKEALLGLIETSPKDALKFLDDPANTQNLSSQAVKSLRASAQSRFNYNKKIIVNDLHGKFLEGTIKIEDIEFVQEDIGNEETEKLVKKLEAIQDVKINSAMSTIEEKSDKNLELANRYINAISDSVYGRIDKFKAGEEFLDMFADGEINQEEAKRINKFINEVIGDDGKRTMWEGILNTISAFGDNLSYIFSQSKSQEVSHINKIIDKGDEANDLNEKLLKDQYNSMFPTAPLSAEDKLFDPKREREFVRTPLLERVLKGAGTGYAGMVRGVGGVFDLIGADAVGEAIVNQSKLMAKTYEIPDPDFVFKLSGGFASASTFLLPGIGIARGVKAASYAPKLAAFLGIAVSTALEATIEAGLTKVDGIEKGMTEKESDKASTIVFWSNIPTIAISNALGGMFGIRKGAAILKHIQSGSFEGVQELTQQIISNIAIGDDPLDGALDSLLIGTVTGGGISMATSLSDVVGEIKTSKKILDKLKSESGQADFFPGNDKPKDNTARNEKGEPLELGGDVDVSRETSEVESGFGKEYDKAVELGKETQKIALGELEIDTGINKNALNNNLSSAQEVAKGATKLSDYALGVLSTRAANVSEDLRTKLRRFEHDLHQSRSKAQSKAKGFLGKANTKTMGDDFMIYDRALKNRDMDVINAMNEKHGLTEEYSKVRDLLDDFKQQADDVGVNMGFIENYFPRVVRNVEGLMKEIRGDKDWNSIKEAIRKQEKIEGRTFSEAEQAQLITQMISGYGTNQIGIGGGKFSKKRGISEIPAELEKYYYSSPESLNSYIGTMTNIIEGRKFFGRESKEISSLRSKLKRAKKRLEDVKFMLPSELKRSKLGQMFGMLQNLQKEVKLAPEYKNVDGLEDQIVGLEAYISSLMVRKADVFKKVELKRLDEKINEIEETLSTMNTNIDDSIGQLVSNLIQDGTFSQDKAEEVKDILKARFKQRGISNKFVSFTKDVGYMSTLNDPANGVVQFGDVFLSVLNNNLLNTLGGLDDVVFGNQKITRKDIGIQDIIAAEMSNFSKADKIRDFIFNVSLIKPIDSLGKSTFINASLRKYTKAAKSGNDSLIEEIERIFGNESEQVLDDLKSGELSDNVKFLIFSDLSNIQPISLSEVPAGYLESGNLRIVYQLKTFAIKSLDIARNRAYNKLKNPETRIDGSKELFKVVLTYALMGASADAMKDFLLGRDFDLSDSMIDGVLQLVLANKYTLDRGKRDGLIKSYAQSFIPPFYKPLDDIYSDVMADKDLEDAKTVRNLPWGELYYWWYGGGKGKKRNKSTKKKKVKIIR